MKKCLKTICFVLMLFLLPKSEYAQCLFPDSTHTDNITTNSAYLNWNNSVNADYYRVSYKEQGQGVWLFASNPVNISSITKDELKSSSILARKILPP